MMETKVKIVCSLCGSTIAEAWPADVEAALRLMNKVTLEKPKKDPKHGVICDRCYNLLSADKHLRKVTKEAKMFGSYGAHVMVPGKWTDCAVVVYLLGDEE